MRVLHLPAIEGRVIRQRAGDAVADEWESMLAMHPAIGHVFVVDSVFNLPPRHAREVCEALVARGLRTPWTCYINPVRFDQDLADLMARAGCAGVEIGADSGTDAGLARLNKGFDTERIRATSRTCRRAGIKDCHSFILGTRGETLAEVERSLDFIEELDPFSVILMAYKDDREAVNPELARRLSEFRGGVLEAIAKRAASHVRWVVPTLGLRFGQRLLPAACANWACADRCGSTSCEIRGRRCGRDPCLARAPESATHFDPGRQSAADAARWATLQVPSRRLEWAASQRVAGASGRTGIDERKPRSLGWMVRGVDGINSPSGRHRPGADPGTR